MLAFYLCMLITILFEYTHKSSRRLTEKVLKIRLTWKKSRQTPAKTLSARVKKKKIRLLCSGCGGIHN